MKEDIDKDIDKVQNYQSDLLHLFIFTAINIQNDSVWHIINNINTLQNKN